MIQKYNAFISYRHAPLDSKIAEHVQRKLERFAVPSKIKKLTGKKRIERVFRDKDELPTTSNLTETIYSALDNSDYLIVICSENTKESQWVQREIEYFLSKHSRDNVMTVLCSGEPYDVIPDILKYEDKKVTSEDGSEHTVKIALEPLSCDYRLPIGKADREELPRLAAAVLGCSYDELINRRRAHVLRRVSLVFALILSLMLGLVVYTYDREQRVKQSLDAAMMSRSRYLANASLMLSDNHNDYDAAFLALASLPEGYPEGPVVPETERALVEATRAYTVDDGFNLANTCNYRMSAYIYDFKISEDGESCAAIDSCGNVSIWDTSTHEVKAAFSSTIGSEPELLFADDDILLLKDRNSLRAFDADSGEEKWSYIDEDNRECDDFCVSYEDGYTLLLMTAGTDEYQILIMLDSDSGEIIRTFELHHPEDWDDSYYTRMELDPTQNKVAFKVLAFAVDYEHFAVSILDLNSGAFEYSELYEGDLGGFCWLSNGKLSYLVFDYTLTYYDLLGSFSGSGVFGEKTFQLFCANAEDCSLVWTNEFTFYGNEVDIMITELGPAGGLCCSCGLSSQTFDINSGEVLITYSLNDKIIDVSDRNEDGIPMFITENGSVATPLSLEDGEYVVQRFMTDDIEMAIVNNGIYLRASDNYKVMYYDVNCYDTRFEETEGVVLDSWIVDYFIAEDYLTIIEGNDGLYTLNVIDAKENELVGTLDLYDIHRYGNDYNIVGIYEDKIYISVSTIEGVDMLIVDASSSRLNYDTRQITETYYPINANAEMNDGMICFLDSNDRGKLVITAYDITDDTVESYNTNLNNDEWSFVSDPYEIADAKYFKGAEKIAVRYKGEVFLIDIETGDIISPELPSNWSICRLVVSNGDEIAFIDDYSIVICNNNGDEIWTFGTDGNAIAANWVEINDEEVLLVLNDCGILNRYYFGDEVMSYTSNTSIYYNDNDFVRHIDYEAGITYDEDSGCVYVTDSSYLCCVIDVSNWYEVACLNGCLGHNDAADRFFSVTLYSGADRQLGSFEHYSIDQLIEMADEITNGSPVPIALANQYGI